MLVINYNTEKNKFVKTRSTSFIKITVSVLVIASLLAICLFSHFGSNTNQTNQARSLEKNAPASELPLHRPYVPDSVTYGKSLVYVKTDKLASAGKLFTFTISATDADGDQLGYSTSGLPDGANFDSDTQTFSWTPRYDQAGVYSVHFEVSDGELTDAEDVNITVAQLYPDWDVNGDGATNVLDMVLVGQCWGEAGLTGWILEDTNEDGAVNVLDMIIIGQRWTG
jgi:hypothetical protein